MSIVKSFNKSVNALGKPSIRFSLYQDNAGKQNEQYVNHSGILVLSTLSKRCVCYNEVNYFPLFLAIEMKRGCIEHALHSGRVSTQSLPLTRYYRQAKRSKLLWQLNKKTKFQNNKLHAKFPTKSLRMPSKSYSIILIVLTL